MPKNKEKELLNANNNIESSLKDTEEIDVKENIKENVAQVEDSTINNTSDTEKKQSVLNASDVANTSLEETESDYETADSDIEESNEQERDLLEKFMKCTFDSANLEIEGESEDKHVMDDILTPVDAILRENGSDAESTENEDDETDEDDDDDDDNENGWITPGNLTNIKNQMNLEILEEKTATVACLTMDFAMQNVLMQMGLNVVSLDGRIIKQMRTFIFRCYACFKTTSVMTKIFCPHCGNKTLKKVEITLDENGQQQAHINFRRPLSAKGKKFSLPHPKGGKHANNPILCEDQPVPEQRPSRLARMKNDPLGEDYIAGYSPFIMRDINSRSAMLGKTAKYWMRKNPNESRRKRK
ncbi:RNA-binding protein NOB1 [Ooceraea biroi]|uniref:RNA-binding protein NOB1 n=2 Tax=Ooceraea biroi TaxID=2015173 RepID=A0A026W9R6_OOCBI|nr:RNA-binding protein NOB1 [Ooceraea biroi]